MNDEMCEINEYLSQILKLTEKIYIHVYFKFIFSIVILRYPMEEVFSYY